MKSSVIVFPGSNCDRDIAVALEKMQFKNKMIWHKETFLPKTDLEKTDLIKAIIRIMVKNLLQTFLVI